MHAVGALAILVLTLGLVLARPRGLPEGVAATLGAGLALLTGVAAPSDLAAGLGGTAGILVFLVAVMVLTPLVCALVLPLRLDARPFVLACAFVANTASLALPVSNLTNMLVYELLEVGFWDFVRYLALPNAVALALNLALLLALYWRRLPGSVRVSGARLELPPEPFFRWSLGVLGVTIVALLVAGLVGWAFWPFALVGAVVLAGMALGRGWVGPALVLGTVAWGLPPFVVGMYVVVAGVYRALEPALVRLPEMAAQLPGPLPLVSAVVAAALGANAVNNLPLSLAAIQLLRTVGTEVSVAGGGSLRETLAFGTLIGVNLGPNLTVTGSLATMLCLASGRRAGVGVSAMEFFRVGMVVSLAPMVAATAVLWLLLGRG